MRWGHRWIFNADDDDDDGQCIFPINIIYDGSFQLHHIKNNWLLPSDKTEVQKVNKIFFFFLSIASTQLQLVRERALEILCK